MLKLQYYSQEDRNLLLEFYPEPQFILKEEWNHINGNFLLFGEINPSIINNQIISNIPNPSVVDCGELGTFEVTDGIFKFTIDASGNYILTVKSVPYLDKSFEVVIP